MFCGYLSVVSCEHSFAIFELLNTKAGCDPSLIVKSALYLSAMAPKVMWGGWVPNNRGRWPIIGDAPGAVGAVLAKLTLDLLRRQWEKSIVRTYVI